jgi:ribonuclease HI
MRHVKAWCDGSSWGSSNPKKAKAGIGVVILHEGKRIEYGRSAGKADCNRAEILAIREVLKVLLARDEFCHDLTVTIYTDSEYARMVLSKKGTSVENWKLVEDVKATMKEFGRIHLRWCKGHAGHKENVRADYLAGVGSGKYPRIG